MARGNSRAQSEARSPEVLSVRSAMKTGSIKASEAIDKDPTLNAVLTNPDVVKAIEKRIGTYLDDAVADASSGDGGTTIEPETTYFQVGGKYFALQVPSIDVEYETEDESFDYDYGSISSTEEVFVNSMTGSSINDADDLFIQSTIREVDRNSDEGKLLQSATKRDGIYSRIMMPKTKGLEPLIPIDESDSYYLAKSNARKGKADDIDNAVLKRAKESGVKD